METWIAAIRWLGLIGALLLTLVVLKEVFLVLRTLGHIETLSVRIRDAAREMARHVRHADRLGRLDEPLDRVVEGAGDLREGARAVRRRTATLAGAPTGAGGSGKSGAARASGRGAGEASR